MKNVMRIFCFVLVLALPLTVSADFTPTSMPAAYILMDYDTGTVMAEHNADEPRPIASVTKVMTMLLCMEAIQAGKITFDDVATASEYACGMGGSQIYLEPGEQMSVTELLKSIAVGSANDACVVMAEHIMGSETAFVDAMNERAKALGMVNTHFVNTNGLDADNHYSSARDVAIMSRELLKHKDIRPFLTIWMDTVRDGKFGLSNTNKLIRFYEGAIGVKTGSTSKAKYCLSAAATRNELTLVGVVLGAETTGERFEIAKQLLNYGFANYKISSLVSKDENMGEVKIKKGIKENVKALTGEEFKMLTDKQKDDNTECKVILEEEVKAPVKKGQQIGKIEIISGGKALGEVKIVAAEDVARMGTADVLLLLLRQWFLK